MSSAEAMGRDARDDVIELIYEIVGAPKDAPYGDLPGYVRDALRSERVAKGATMTPRQIALRCAEMVAPGGDREAIRALAATLPDEGQWVPREPTQEQMIAGAEVKQPNGFAFVYLKQGRV